MNEVISVARLCEETSTEEHSSESEFTEAVTRDETASEFSSILPEYCGKRAARVDCTKGGTREG
jgi:hypothetical protein